MLPIECIVRGYLVGLGLEGVPAHRHHARPGRCPPACRSPTAARARVHPVDQGRRRRPRREHLVRRRRGDSSAATSPSRPRARLAVYERGAAPAAERGHHHRRHQVRARLRSTASCRCATRCSRPTRPASGRPTDWKPGTAPPSFDKQPVRDWLEATGWDKTPPPPALPAEVVAATSDRYVAAYERVTGQVARGLAGLRRAARCGMVTPMTLSRPGGGHPPPRDRRSPGGHHRAVAARPRLRRRRRGAGGQGHPLHRRGRRRGRRPAPGSRTSAAASSPTP